MIFKCRNYKLDLSNKTHIMGILNITPDSFSDGGRFFKSGLAVKHALDMVENGADIIDIGGESTRPGSNPITVKEEIKRVLPVLKELIKKTKVPISVDTYKYEVVKVVLEEGASIINDISGLHFDKRIAKLISKYKAGIVIMHIKGTPRNMQETPHYKNVIKEIADYIKEGIKNAVLAKIDRSSIMIDPGLGFGKTLEHNLAIFKRLNEFKKLGFPILIGPSRKSFIGKILNLPVTERLEGTLGAVAVSILNGANVIRVHDVKEVYRVTRVVEAIMKVNR
ncbi:MAG: dihydropteroate synthase [Candidatus Firestonebacteria bacterium]